MLHFFLLLLSVYLLIFVDRFLPPLTTVADCVKSLTQQFILNNTSPPPGIFEPPTPAPASELTSSGSEPFQLVLPPSQSHFGSILEPEMILKDVVESDTVLEMWAQPIRYKVALSVAGTQPVFQGTLSFSLSLSLFFMCHGFISRARF